MSDQTNNPSAAKPPAAAKSAAKPKTRKVRLPLTLHIDGKDYPPGTEVTLDADEAASLVERFGEVKAPAATDDEDSGA